MSKHFENFLLEIILRDLKTDRNNTLNLSKKESTKEFRGILDRISKELIHNTFENVRLDDALMRLPRIERIIIVLNLVLNMDLQEIAFLLDVSLNSVYVQKHNAIKRLRDLMND